MRVPTTSRRFSGAIALACALGLAMPAMALATPTPTATVSPASPTVKPPTTSKITKLPADEAFKTTALATAHCPSDTVVWSTLSKSKSYHMATSKYYGKTKHGAYVCQKDATAAGFHASKE